ncbi:hypothetical protein F5Y03DRAFT_390025 [Xylaria venustula]|nr:hypothetical protein F5Y03DRAFT_390025 [Xylaria venustula]
MQVLESQDPADRSHGAPVLSPHGVADLGFYHYHAPVHDHGIWTPPERAWHQGDYITSHHAVDYFVCPEAPQSPTGAKAANNNYNQAVEFHVPFVGWPTDFALGPAYEKYNNPTAPSNTNIYPPIPQYHMDTQPDSLETLQEMEWTNGALLPVSPSSPKESPTPQQKRNRNRLAAAKCRKKAKRGVDELQQRERDLLRENKMLSAQAGLLREEVLQLKTEILRHNKCDNDFISQYIRKTAKQVGVVPDENADCEAPNGVDF